MACIILNLQNLASPWGLNGINSGYPCLKPGTANSKISIKYYLSDLGFFMIA